MRFKHSLLLVQDIERSKEFYQRLFNLKIIHDFGAHVTFEGGLAIHEASDYQKMTGVSITDSPKGHFSAVYFESEHLVEDFVALQNANVTFAQPIALQSWNQQVFRCYDPDGHLIEVGESMEQVILNLQAKGKDRDEIIRMTSLPQDHVDMVLERTYGDRQYLKS